MTTYDIDDDDENNLPFGMLSNNFNFAFTINNEEWSNCSQYIYVNCLHHVLNQSTFLNHRKEKYIDQMMKSPLYETYAELLKLIVKDMNYNWYYTEILSKLTSDTNFAEFIVNGEWGNKTPDDAILHEVMTSMKNKLMIKEYYNFYPSYIIIKIVVHMLLYDLENFSKIQLYLQMIENKKSTIIHDIIKEFDFSKLQKLDIYDFESDVENDKELLKVLELSQSYPNILFIYAFKYNLRDFKERMEQKYKNKILELFLKYKNNCTESAKKELYLVNNVKLKEIILELVWQYDDKFRRYTEKDETLREIINSKISDEKILEYENFNFYEIKETKVEIKNIVSQHHDYTSYLDTLHKTDKSHFLPSNLERIKEVLATVALYKKFNVALPQNQIDNYHENLPSFLKSHVNFELNSDRKYIDLQFNLYLTKGIELKYNTDDTTLSEFLGPLLSKMSLTVKGDAFNVYKEKVVDFKTLFQDDLFLNLWMKKQLQYLSRFISVLIMFLDANHVTVTTDIIQDVLYIFSDNIHFNKLKTTFDDIPVYFNELLEYYFELENTAIGGDKDKKTFSVMIWNFITYNLQTLLKTRDVFKIKLFLTKNILRLRQFPQCVENLENNDIACYTFAIINVANKLDKVRVKQNIGDMNLGHYVEAILLNQKYFSDIVESNNEINTKDITEIVSRIFAHNNSILKSVLPEKEIVKIVEKIKDIDDKYKINMWVNIFS
jgi:hypothetical protein